MGWMSWQFFRCEIDCDKHPTACINEALYKSQTDALVSGGYVAAGYNGIHIDDCVRCASSLSHASPAPMQSLLRSLPSRPLLKWMRLNPVRDPLTGRLVPNATRFPSGMQALGDYMHAVGTYSDFARHAAARAPRRITHERPRAPFAAWRSTSVLLGVKFGQYTAESSGTCAGYPASKGHEDLDAQTFADVRVPPAGQTSGV